MDWALSSKSVVIPTRTKYLGGTPAAADLFVTPYGSYSHFIKFPTNWTLEIDTPLFSESVGVSELDNGFGGGIALGFSLEDKGAIVGLNVEFISGKTDTTFTNQGITLGDRSIDSSALTVGGFIGAIIAGNSEGNFQSVIGIEIGALMPQGDISLMYTEEVVDSEGIISVVDVNEKQELEGPSLYMSFFFTEDFSISKTFGLSGTLGYRGVKTTLQNIETESMSGKYFQEYSGFFLRFGLKIDL